jgi:hypothetical protein
MNFVAKAKREGGYARRVSQGISSAALRTVLFSVSAAVLFTIIPAHAVGKTTAADAPLIDTAMPATIPREILDDWRAQGISDPVLGHRQRVGRILPFAKQLKKIIFARHYNEGGTIYGFLEDMNGDGFGNVGGKFAGTPAMSKGSKYKAGAALLVLNFTNCYPAPTPLLEDTKGVIRDPCVAFDGKKIAFAWAKNNNGYNIYEIQADTPYTIRQLTSNPGGYVVSDFEPCYVPSGDIIFNSSRCFQGHAVNFNVVSNLYIMNKDGKYLRRICFDQAHDFHPTVGSDGRVYFSRWEFNDRNAADCFGVFSMNPDGSNQMEYFGNQLGSPAGKPYVSLLPGGGEKFLLCTAIQTGSVYQGELCMVDPAKGRNCKDAVMLIAPKRGDPGCGLAEENRKFQTPFALDTAWFLVSYAPDGSGLTARFGLYLMDVNGNRELLAWDSVQSVSQPFPLCERTAPHIGCRTDYTKKSAEMSIASAYYGTGTAGVAPGSIKKIRVIALDYCVYPWFGNTGSTEYSATPVARHLGSRLAKRIVGEMKVEADGSAAFLVPPRRPLYFQLIDSLGCMIQSMRSWVTLQPGERFDCLGCHEDKNTAPPSPSGSLAPAPKKLEPFFDILDDYLYYPLDIQPILEAKCISCHTAGHTSGLDLRGDKHWTGDLADDADNATAERFWCRSYMNLSSSRYVNYMNIFGPAQGRFPATSGSSQSWLVDKLRARSGGMDKVIVSEEEIGKICAWIDLGVPHGGAYTDDMNEADKAKYLARLKIRQDLEAIEAKEIQAFVGAGGYTGLDSTKLFAIGDGKRTSPPTRKKASEEAFAARFLSGSHRLSMKLPSAGKVTVVDCRGRIITRMQATNAELLKSGGAVQSAVVGAVKGLFMVKFSARDNGKEKTVMVPAL